MAGLIKLLIALLFAAALAAGTWYFANKLYFAPQEQDRLEQEQLAKQAAQAALPPPPDFTIAIFDKVKAIEDPDERIKQVKDFMVQYPESSRLAEAKDLLGETNANLFFSSQPTSKKETYKVTKGDALVKIATKYQTSAELLMRINNLLTYNLRIGQELLVPKIAPRIVIKPEAHTLTVFFGDEFFKEYHFESAGSVSKQSTKIGDKFAMNDGKRAAFGTKEFVDADRTMILSPGGTQIQAKSDVIAGIMLPREDIEEIYPLVSIGTPVSFE